MFGIVVISDSDILISDKTMLQITRGPRAWEVKNLIELSQCYATSEVRCVSHRLTISELEGSKEENVNTLINLPSFIISSYEDVFRVVGENFVATYKGALERSIPLSDAAFIYFAKHNDGKDVYKWLVNKDDKMNVMPAYLKGAKAYIPSKEHLEKAPYLKKWFDRLVDAGVKPVKWDLHGDPFR